MWFSGKSNHLTATILFCCSPSNVSEALVKLFQQVRRPTLHPLSASLGLETSAGHLGDAPYLWVRFAQWKRRLWGRFERRAVQSPIVSSHVGGSVHFAHALQNAMLCVPLFQVLPGEPPQATNRTFPSQPHSRSELRTYLHSQTSTKHKDFRFSYLVPRYNDLVRICFW